MQCWFFYEFVGVRIMIMNAKEMEFSGENKISPNLNYFYLWNTCNLLHYTILKSTRTTSLLLFFVIVEMWSFKWIIACQISNYFANLQFLDLLFGSLHSYTGCLHSYTGSSHSYTGSSHSYTGCLHFAFLHRFLHSYTGSCILTPVLCFLTPVLRILTPVLCIPVHVLLHSYAASLTKVGFHDQTVVRFPEAFANFLLRHRLLSSLFKLLPHYKYSHIFWYSLGQFQETSHKIPRL